MPNGWGGESPINRALRSILEQRRIERVERMKRFSELAREQRQEQRGLEKEERQDRRTREAETKKAQTKGVAATLQGTESKQVSPVTLTQQLQGLVSAYGPQEAHRMTAEAVAQFRTEQAKTREDKAKEQRAFQDDIKLQAAKINMTEGDPLVRAKRFEDLKATIFRSELGSRGWGRDTATGMLFDITGQGRTISPAEMAEINLGVAQKAVDAIKAQRLKRATSRQIDEVYGRLQKQLGKEPTDIEVVNALAVQGLMP
jgi:hypothetical protein